MGNCIQKPKKIVIKDSSIEVVNNIPPMDPSKDPFGNYLWINIHTNNVNFLKKQEEGFVLSMSDDSSIGYKWLRKNNSEKSNFSGNTSFPIISGIIMENYSNNSNNNSNNNNNNNNNSNYNSNDWPSPPGLLPQINNQLHENNNNNNSNNDCQLPSI